MGGVCGKPSGINDDDDGRGSLSSRRDRVSRRASSEPRHGSSKRLESFRVKNRVDITSGSIDNRLNSSSRRVRDNYDNKNNNREVSDQVFIATNVPKVIQQGQQVVPGWPSWLASVAAEALNGWLPRRADTFEKLDKVSLSEVDFLEQHYALQNINAFSSVAFPVELLTLTVEASA